MRRALGAAALAAFTLLPAPFESPASAQTLSSLDKEMSDLIDRLAPSVVRVGERSSGVCVSQKGHILSDFAVVKEMERKRASTLPVTFSDQRTYEAKVVGSDEATQTALLRVDAKRAFPAVRPGNPAALEVGHYLLTIGNSFGTSNESEPSATLGVLSAIHRDEKLVPQLLETSAATNVGQDGGPYFNAGGDLIGIERDLPDAENLARLTPIDRIIAAYSALDRAETIFERPRVLAPPATPAQVLSKAFAIAARRGRPCVVTLVTSSAVATNATAEAPAPGQVIPQRKGPVSGTLVDASGLVVASAASLPESVGSIDAHLADGRSFPATVVARDRKAGLALLVLDKKAEDSLPLIPERSSTELEIGRFVLALGAPHGPPATQDAFVTVGILSARNQLDPYRDALQTDAGVNVKNAGGALVDLRGRLVGILLPPQLPFGQNSGLGFAMPIENVRAQLKRWSAGGSIEPGMLGVQLVDPSGGGERGARVTKVSSGMPAAVAGIRENDLITHLDGEAIASQQEFSDWIYARKCAGDSVTLTVKRGTESLQIAVVLAKRQ